MIPELSAIMRSVEMMTWSYNVATAKKDNFGT